MMAWQKDSDMSMKRQDVQLRVWLWILAGLLVAGCAADKQQGRMETAEPERSARSPIETPRPPSEAPSTSTPKARHTPPTKEPVTKTPRAHEQAKKTPPPNPPQEQEPAGEENQSARRQAGPVEPQTSRPPTEAPAEPKGEQHAKLPADRVTPLNQSGSKDDVDITRRIRQKLMNEDLSFSAKNVMVITEEDRVVLKGTVNSASEAERVKGVAGALTTKQIEDRLQIGGQ
jgi:hypothetical protein